MQPLYPGLVLFLFRLSYPASRYMRERDEAKETLTTTLLAHNIEGNTK